MPDSRIQEQNPSSSEDFETVEIPSNKLIPCIEVLSGWLFQIYTKHMFMCGTNTKCKQKMSTY